MDKSQKIDQKISQLRERYTNPDSIPDFDLLSSEYRKLVEEKGLVDNPIFKKLTSDAEAKIEEINLLLMNDETLTDSERKNLFNMRKMWRTMFEMFGVSFRDKALEEIEKFIDKKLQE